MNTRRALLFIPIILALVLGAFLFKGLSLNPRELPSALVGKPFPAFELSALQDQAKQLTKVDLPKQPHLVNIWATWCPSCKVEHPQLLSIARDDNIPIVGLNYKDTAPEAQKWLRVYENPYVFNIFDPKGKLGFDLGVYGAPETYIVDAKGIVRYRHAGPIDVETWKTMRNIVRDLEREG
ncbi:DsbE family thiol:disulfide interchange protein [Motiliproteus coralliicola]|uniref:DsbE family thiol:disulfide interchange protein n=1 Tax=Motiliproteus coralliicola TaxID=2283196 RepID=A0A369W7Z2_9GAMM|nr:DsbE family thiol:disulfide interchange protein [Motiliproteus coralliicola]RDE18032.1 DsbE family thiol:disulfide interchange protein [Motiliproteus coralliicola]